MLRPFSLNSQLATSSIPGFYNASFCINANYNYGGTGNPNTLSIFTEQNGSFVELSTVTGGGVQYDYSNVTTSACVYGVEVF